MTLKRIIKILLGKDFFTKMQFRCSTETHGNPGASFTICSKNINENSIVYSFGIGTDVSFDLSLIEKYNMNIFAFDPTPRSLEWLRDQELPEKFKYNDFGLASFDGEASFFSPSNPENVSFSLERNTFVSSDTVNAKVFQLKTIMNKFCHDKIDILKMDIEGAEYDVIKNIVNSGIEISQLLIEFHHRLITNGIQKTKQSIQELNNADYKIFHVSDSGEEFSFIKV